MSWNELYFGRGVNDSAQGFSTTREWAVQGSSPDVAKTEPDAPKFGDAHPDNAGLVVSSVSYEPVGYGTKVRASYVPFEFIPGVPPENTTTEEWIAIDSTFETHDIEIPLFQLVSKSFPVASGGTETKLVYRPVQRVKSYQYTNVVHRVTLNATIMGGPTVDAQMLITEQINQQNDKIHTIAGRDYLFNADGVRRIEADNYQFTYRWTTDRGVPNTLVFDASATENIGFIGSIAFPYADEDYIVPPFKMLDTAPVDNDPTMPPKVTISDRYERDETGWQSLPGVIS